MLDELLPNTANPQAQQEQKRLDEVLQVRWNVPYVTYSRHCSAKGEKELLEYHIILEKHTEFILTKLIAEI